MKGMWAIVLTMCVAVALSATITAPIPCPSDSPKDPCLIEIIRWVSQTSAIVVTNDYKVWRTTNEGKSFTQIGKNVNDVEQHPSNPNVLIFLYDSGQTNFTYTLDGGATLLVGTTPVGRRQVTKMIYHPTEVGKLMYVSCLQGSDHKCSLSTSSDWGKNWKTTFTNVISNSVVNPVIYGNNIASHDLIYILKQDGTFGYSTDYTKFNELVKNAKKIYKGRHYLYVVAANKNGDIKLHSVSLAADTTKSGNYKEVVFPYGDKFEVEDFVFLDDTTTAEYLAVHPSSYGNYGDIFTSDANGLKFELSIATIYKQNIGDYDFHRVRGIDGIYIANQVTNAGSRIPTFKTVITFDNGGEWRALVPPATDMYGVAWPCSGVPADCRLHLHGEGSAEELLGIPALRSHSNAIGVIIANGNVGKELATDIKYVKTFLSNDGGLTWTHIYDKASVFEFGDHGGIIVLAPRFEETNTLMYSFTQGAPFQPANIDFPVSLTVSGIITEPQGTGLNFMVQGTFNQTFYLYTFGLSDAGLPLCGDNDFEYWSPYDGESAVGCLMGQASIYLRRKPSTACYNNRTTDVITKQTPCACSYEDYECAPNYSPSGRDDNTGQFSCTANIDKKDEPKCSPGEKYFESNGYQLVPGTACSLTLDKSLNLLGKQKTCPSSHSTAIVASVVVILIVGVVATLVVLFFKNERFHDFVVSLKPSGKKSSNTGAYRGLTNNNDDDDDDDITV